MLHVSTFLIGHHQAFLHYESIDAIYILGSQYFCIDKICNSMTSVTQVEVYYINVLHFYLCN